MRLEFIATRLCFTTITLFPFYITSLYFIEVSQHSLPFPLLQQRQRTLIALVRLTEHGLARLRKNVVVRVLHHLRGNIRIPYRRLRRCSVLHDIVQIADRVLYAVLDGTQVGTGFGHVLDRALGESVEGLEVTDIRRLI